MVTSIRIGEIEAEVTFKAIRNVHLSVHPPSGRVRIAAPLRMKLDTVRVFAISRLGWIRQQQQTIAAQERETKREYIERESHYVWGRRYLLSVVEADERPSVELRHRQLVLRVRAGFDRDRKLEVVENWLRQQVREATRTIITEWEPKIGVTVSGFYVRRMKTRWGSCNSKAGTIRLNTDLAKKPLECLEYVTVHEMVHILEPTHNERFMALMNQLMPDWKQRRQTLNRLPVRHEDWLY